MGLASKLAAANAAGPTGQPFLQPMPPPQYGAQARPGVAVLQPPQRSGGCCCWSRQPPAAPKPAAQAGAYGQQPVAYNPQQYAPPPPQMYVPQGQPQGQQPPAPQYVPNQAVSNPQMQRQAQPQAQMQQPQQYVPQQATSQPQPQPQMYAPPAPAGGAGGYFPPAVIMQHLSKIASQNGLAAFYSAERLQQLAQKVSQSDLAGLAARWRLAKEIVLDLTALSLYDIAIYADDSGSMAYEEQGERIEDLKTILAQVADVVTMFDDDGILISFMNSPVQVSVRSAQEASALLVKTKFAGQTPMGTALDRKILQPLVLAQASSGSLAKPVLVVIITDGEPSGEPRDTLVNVLRNAKAALSRTAYGPGACAFQLAQVGKDAAAQRFLGEIDSHPEVGRMVDATSYYEMEAEEFSRNGVELTPNLYLVKLMVGAIDRSYDEADE